MRGFWKRHRLKREALKRRQLQRRLRNAVILSQDSALQGDLTKAEYYRKIARDTTIRLQNAEYYRKIARDTTVRLQND